MLMCYDLLRLILPTYVLSNTAYYKFINLVILLFKMSLGISMLNQSGSLSKYMPISLYPPFWIEAVTYYAIMSSKLIFIFFVSNF